MSSVPCLAAEKRTPETSAPPDRWLLDHLPASLNLPGPFGIVAWQWCALPVALLIALVAGRLVAWMLTAGLARISKRTTTTWDDAIVARLRGPCVAVCRLLVAYPAFSLLGLAAPAERFVLGLVRGLGLVAFFWGLARVIDVSVQVAERSRWVEERPASRSLLPLANRMGKVAVAVFALIAFLSELGYPSTSLLAGLGIGGVALALAAQKTVENLFGAFSIGADQPFRLGDFVRVDDFVGTVEAVGLRSTRIRTLDRTVVTIPNGKLAEMRLESFSARDRIRLACDVGLVYGTSAEQMRTVLRGLERVLRCHPKIWPEAVIVRFKELGASSLNIEVMCWFLTSDWGEFQEIREDVLLQFMSVVERAGSAFAFPTRTLHLVSNQTHSTMN